MITIVVKQSNETTTTSCQTLLVCYLACINNMGCFGQVIQMSCHVILTWYNMCKKEHVHTYPCPLSFKKKKFLVKVKLPMTKEMLKFNRPMNQLVLFLGLFLIYFFLGFTGKKGSITILGVLFIDDFGSLLCETRGKR